MGNVTLLHGPAGSLRIIAAMAAKDFGDAFRNRQLLSILIMVFAMAGLYRLMPLLMGRSALPNLLLYDAGTSVHVSELQASADLNLFVYQSSDLPSRQLTELDAREIALVLPADFDARLAAGEIPQLTGQVPYWLTPEEAAALAGDMTAALSRSIGQPVAVNLAAERVYPPIDSYGPSFFAGLSVVIMAALIGLMLVPALMLEEKRARTLDVLLVSPATPAQIVGGKTVAALAFVGLALVPCLYFYGNLIVHWWLAGLALALVALFSVGLGLLLGLLAKQRQQVQLAVLILGQPLLAPVFLMMLAEILPAWLVTVFHWIPTVAALVVVRAACTRPLAPTDFGVELTLLAASTVAVIGGVILLVRRQDR